MTTKHEVVFSANLEYEHNLRVEGRYLDPDSADLNLGVKSLRKGCQEGYGKSPSDMMNIFGIEVKTRIISTRYGSLTIFLVRLS